jgi:hypothetical protein
MPMFLTTLLHPSVVLSSIWELERRGRWLISHILKKVVGNIEKIVRRGSNRDRRSHALDIDRCITSSSSRRIINYSSGRERKTSGAFRLLVHKSTSAARSRTSGGTCVLCPGSALRGPSLPSRRIGVEVQESRMTRISLSECETRESHSDDKPCESYCGGDRRTESLNPFRKEGPKPFGAHNL